MTDNIAEKPAKKTKDSESVEQQLKTEVPEQLIYVGDNVTALNLRKFAVYRHGIPAEIQALTDKYPILKELIIDVKEYTRNAGTINTGFYAEMNKKFLEGLK